MSNNLCVVNNSLSCEETRPLLFPSSVTNESLSSQRLSCEFLKSICPPSKAAGVLICLAVVVGTMHAALMCIFAFVAIFFVGTNKYNIIHNLFLVT